MVGDISPDDLDDLMGGDEKAPDSPAEAPGMLIEDMSQQTGDNGSNDDRIDDHEVVDKY